MGKTHLEHNIAVHNKIAQQYEVTHGEIYNEREQSRLRTSLEKALSFVATGNTSLRALDFGCGAGNLTTHLTELWCEVIAADVSTGFLDLVASRIYKNKVVTKHLNGVDLQGIEDGSMDVVATYSVLHHVPEYLSLMKEFARVLRPGGVVYIDHEASERMWERGGLDHFRNDMKNASKKDWKKYLVFTNYIDRFIRTFLNPKYQREGDIHVFEDDHIEWDSIRNALNEHGVVSMFEEDYLLFRRNYDVAIYEAWKDKGGDMHLYIGRKE